MRAEEETTASPGPRAKARWRRVVLRIALALALAAVLLPALLVLGLRSQAVRQSLLRRVAAAVEERTGLQVAAEDFRLALRRAELEVDRLELAAETGAPPFFTAPRARTVWRWSSLFGGDRPVIELLEVERPVFDATSPLPSSTPPAAVPAEREPLALDILEVRLTGGSIVSPELPDRFDAWLDTARVDRLELGGSYVSGTAAIERAEGRLRLASHRRPKIELDFTTAALFTADGELRVESLSLDGDGFELTAAGFAPPAREAEAELELEADLGRLAPDLAPAGRVSVSGRLVKTESGVRADGRLGLADLPAELVEPLLPPVALERITLAATRIDVDSEFDLAADDLATLEIDGAAELTWRRGSEVLAAAEVGVRRAESNAAAITFAAVALPAQPGARRASGELLLPSWTEPATAELRALEIELRTDDIAASARRLGLSSEAIGRWGLAGRFSAEVEASGPVLRPEVAGDAVWTRDARPLVVLSLRSVGPLDLERKSLGGIVARAELWPRDPGTRRVEVTLRLDGSPGLDGVTLSSSRLLVQTAELGDLRLKLDRQWPFLLERLALLDDLAIGALDLEARATGPVTGPELEISLDWRPADEESITLDARGRVALDSPLSGPLEARLGVAGLTLDRFQLVDEAGESLAGRLDATARVDRRGEEWSADLKLAAQSLGYGDRRLESLEMEAAATPERVELLDFATRLGEALGGGEIRARLGFEPGRPIRGADASIHLIRPIAGVESIAAEARLDGGTLVLDPIHVRLDEAEGAPAALAATIPLGGLQGLPAARTILARLPVELDPGPITVETESIDLAPVWGLVDGASGLAITGGLTADLRVDPADPTGLEGRIRLDDLELTGPNGRLAAKETLELVLGARELRLAPATLRALKSGDLEGRETELLTSGGLRFDPSWDSSRGWLEAIESFSFDLAGRLDASLLDLVLAGGVATGPVDLDVRLEGSPAAPEGRLRLRGAEATVSFAIPHLIRFERPDVDIRVVGGRAEIEAMTVTVNRGRVALYGSAGGADDLDLALTAAGVRLRIGWGLTLLLDGDLSLTSQTSGSTLLAGEVVAQRGSLRRDIEIDRELLNRLFAAPIQESAEPGLLDDVQLDVDITTLEGVSVRNNIANLRFDWPLLRVRGSLGQPLVRGRFEVEPGGRITAYGQTVRIDEGALILSGDPDIEPRLILETTSSLEDPTLNQDEQWWADTSWGSRSAWSTDLTGSGESAGTEALVTGVTTHYTERLASALGGALTGTEVSYQALPLFGERDTQGRWTLSQRLSPRVTFISSRNPRKAEGTTNLVSLHGLARAPGVSAQIFNTDDGNDGVAVQRTQRLGGGADRSSGPLLRRIEVDAPAEISARRLRQASGLRRGDPAPEGTDFDVEVDLQDFMIRNGFPGSEVRARLHEGGRGLVDVEVKVATGPRVRAVFEGDLPPRPARSQIPALYRPARLAEAASLEDVRQATVQSLRGRGFLRPEVEVTVEPDDPGRTDGDRTLRITAVGGRRINPEAPSFQGLEPEIADRLATIFDTPLERIELAAAVPGADASARRALQRLGYPDPAIVSREISTDGRTLTVVVEPGRRRTVDVVTMTGLPADELEGIRPQLPLRAGEPLLAEQIVRAVALVESDLQRRGYIDASIDVSLAETHANGAVDVHLEIDTGTSYRIATTRLEGLRTSRAEWAEARVEIEPGTVLTRGEIAEARQRLQQTGVFARIGTEIDRDGGEATVVFEVEERPRFTISYGGRWDDSEGVGGAVYLTDHNFLGRGQSLGLRAIYLGDKDRALGLHHAWPNVGGSRNLLEFFVEDSTGVDTGIVVDGIEGWTQLTVPLSRRRQTRFYAQFQDRSFQPEDPLAIADEDAQSLFLGWQYIFDGQRRGPGERPKGLFVGLDFSGTSEILGSDFGELRAFAQGTLLYPIDNGRLSWWSERPLRWAQSVRIGWLESLGGTIPRVDRLTAGGEYSVRGYATDTLGPRDERGFPVGGEAYLILNHELHLPLVGDVDTVLFVDIGNVWESTSLIDGELFSSAGVGFRSPSPIGPLRLDFAWPLDRRPDIDSTYKIYFGFGPTF